MAANTTVWGIDLGKCALKAVALRQEGDGVEAIDHVFIEHPRILSQPDADAPALIAKAMNKFAEKRDFSKAKIVVGVPGQHTLARFTKLPPVEKKKIPQIVEYEAQQQIPFDLEEVIWDYQVFEDPDGVDTEVGIFAMRREILHSHLRPLTDMNLEPAAVQASPLALYAAMKYDGLIGEEAVAILDIGTVNTDLIVADGDSLWTRTIPIGGNNFTEAVLKTFKLSFNKAERLKREAQKHKYARQIFQAMRPVFADLVAEIQRSIGFFTSSRRGVKLKKILAMGNAFMLPGMVKFIQQNLGMEVSRVTSFNKLQASRASNAPELMKQLHGLGVAYGLALQGLELSPITSSLLPPEIAKQIVWRKKTPFFYGAAACLVLSAVTVWGRNFSDDSIVDKAQGTVASMGYPMPPSDPKDPNFGKPAGGAIRDLVRPQGADETAYQYGHRIKAAGQHMNQVLSQIQSKNTEIITQAENMAKLQSQKTVWPKILHMVHSAVPPVEDQLAEAMAKGSEAYCELVTTDPKYKRSKRRQVFIEKLESTYSADVMATLEGMKGMQPSAGPMDMSMAAAPAAPTPGFAIRLIGRTPYEQATQFIQEAFLNKLQTVKEAGEKLPNVDIYFDGVQMLRINRLSQGRSDPIGGGLTTGYTKTIRAGALDPLTNELMTDDWEFEVVFAAVLAPKPETPPMN
jgi:type IV pilus assembly protein PilM